MITEPMNSVVITDKETVTEETAVALVMLVSKKVPSVLRTDKTSSYKTVGMESSVSMQPKEDAFSSILGVMSDSAEENK